MACVNARAAAVMWLQLPDALRQPHAACCRSHAWFDSVSAHPISLHGLQVGDWVATRKDIEHVNAAWLILPVSNFVAALVGPSLDQAYVPAMQFWFAFALMLWVLLFAITFAKAILVTDNGGCNILLVVNGLPRLQLVCTWMLHGCMAAWLHGCMADVFMQPRAITAFTIPVVPHTHHLLLLSRNA
jgi:hypothetical protein